MVNDIVTNNECKWPDEWLSKHHSLALVTRCNIDDSKEDLTVWRSKTGREGTFSVRQAYIDMQYEEEDVNWSKIVWFSQNIPKHAFMAIQKRLNTQDMMRKWGSYDMMVCALCKCDCDSHNHLFFQCN